MKERVIAIIGNRPIILVAPHGADDVNTDIVAEHAAKILSCCVVANRGFQRSNDVDVERDKADCNKINHCLSEVVFEEFLKPILKFKDKITQGIHQNKNPIKNMYSPYETVHLFFIHGCGDMVNKEAKEQVGLIVGYGLGVKKDSLTCDVWRKNLFVHLYRKFSKNGDIFEGKCGGKYAGRNKNNLNQYFRKKDMDVRVQSMQLEIPYSFRKTKDTAIDTANLLSSVIMDYYRQGKFELEPNKKLI